MIGFFSLYDVLDDFGLFHLHSVKVVLGVYVHNLFNGSLLDLVLRFPIFGWSLRVRDCVTFETLVVDWINLLSLHRLLEDLERLHLSSVHDLLHMCARAC